MRLILATAAISLALATHGVARAASTASKLVRAYTLQDGETSTPIAVPRNIPVQLMGVQVQAGFRGVASATILKIDGHFVEWIGLDSPSPSPAAITSGFSGNAGTHVLWLDYGHAVDVQVGPNLTLQIHNASGAVATGRIALIY